MFDAIRRHRAATKDTPIKDLQSPARARDFALSVGPLRFDYSRTALDATGRDLLVGLLDAVDLAGKRAAMFSGAPINATEGRAVLHTALRQPSGPGPQVDGADVLPQVHETLERMNAFAADLRSGRFTVTGGQVTDVINIGIGGSNLGPAMAAQALAPYADGPRCHFVSNVDPADISDALALCDPARTLVIVASKTFTTIETMTNAETARAWLRDAGVDPAAHLVALSSAVDKTAAWGIPPERVFGFEDWVGGRYSLWGPIGLSLMLAIGPNAFAQMLAGAHEMDVHFRTAPWAQNMPALHALVGLWHNQVCGYATRAVLPYDNRLAQLPAYLQQLEMESNGKRVAMDGTPLAEQSGPVVWGAPGTDGQHAFYQLLHQGTQVVPCEFMIAAQGHAPDLHHQHQLLVANCLAQAEALMTGRDLDTARAKVAGRFSGAELERQAAHRVFPGNRPSVTFSYPQLTPHLLGMLIALYEHRVFVEGVVLGLNSYDQWGVELGKELAISLQPAVEGSAAPEDPSSAALLAALHEAGL